MRDEISAWLDGELDTDASVRMRRALERSPRLRAQHNAASDARAALRGLPRVAPPPELWRRLGVPPPPLPGGRAARLVPARALAHAWRRQIPAYLAAATVGLVGVATFVNGDDGTAPAFDALQEQHAIQRAGDPVDGLLTALDGSYLRMGLAPDPVLVSQP